MSSNKVKLINEKGREKNYLPRSYDQFLPEAGLACRGYAPRLLFAQLIKYDIPMQSNITQCSSDQLLKTR